MEKLLLEFLSKYLLFVIPIVCPPNVTVAMLTPSNLYPLL